MSLILYKHNILIFPIPRGIPRGIFGVFWGPHSPGNKFGRGIGNPSTHTHAHTHTHPYPWVMGGFWVRCHGYGWVMGMA